jgi:hypothetical protein
MSSLINNLKKPPSFPEGLHLRTPESVQDGKKRGTVEFNDHQKPQMLGELNIKICEAKL